MEMETCKASPHRDAGRPRLGKETKSKGKCLMKGLDST